jgi:hypothetical protein
MYLISISLILDPAVRVLKGRLGYGLPDERPGGGTGGFGKPDTFEKGFRKPLQCYGLSVYVPETSR